MPSALLATEPCLIMHSIPMAEANKPFEISDSCSNGPVARVCLCLHGYKHARVSLIGDVGSLFLSELRKKIMEFIC